MDLQMKICILSNAHPSDDVRLYYKMARSLARIALVHLICRSGVRNRAANPYQIVVSSDTKWGSLFRIYRKARKIRPDIAICVEPLTILAGMALKRKYGTKLVFDVHEFYPDAFAERFPAPFKWLMKNLYLGIERWLQARVDATIGVSDGILDQLVPSWQRDSAITIPNYPVKNVWDYSCETPSDISTLCETNFDLIYIGGITVDRGIFKILKSAWLLKRDFPSISVLILGKFFSSDLEKQFNAYINSHNLNAIIYYQSWLPAEKIGLLLKRSKVGLWLFNPQNRRMRKAVPLKVLEYFAAGLPVVSINTPLMRNLVEQNGAGLCSEYQSDSIAQAVAGILGLKKPEYEAMSRRAARLIEERYNWEALEPRLLDLVQKLAGE